MAMSRSFGSSLLMGRPSKVISPALSVSSPARMRSVVDLPQPDGPTSTVNSPSGSVRFSGGRTLVEPNAFSTSSNTISGIQSAPPRRPAPTPQ